MSIKDVRKNIVDAIPYARRYGRALTGDTDLSDLILSQASVNVIKRAPPSSKLLPKNMILPLLLMEFHRVLDARDNNNIASNSTAKITRTDTSQEAPLYERIDQALSALTKKQRRVFLLIALEQFRPAVISRILSIPCTEVKQDFKQAHMIVNRFFSDNEFNQVA